MLRSGVISRLGRTAAVRGSHRRCRAVTVPAMRPPAAMPWAGAVTSPRRARLLVSGAAVALLVTPVTYSFIDSLGQRLRRLRSRFLAP